MVIRSYNLSMDDSDSRIMDECTSFSKIWRVSWEGVDYRSVVSSQAMGARLRTAGLWCTHCVRVQLLRLEKLLNKLGLEQRPQHVMQDLRPWVHFIPSRHYIFCFQFLKMFFTYER